MQTRKHAVALSCAAIAALSATVSAGVRAETLVYITPTAIGTVDSSNPGQDNTAGNNGPLGYSLPSGYNPVGAEVSVDSQTLYLLASNGSTCQLYSVNTNGSGGSAGLSEVNASYSCSYPLSSGDIAFINGTGGSATDQYIVANGSAVDEIPAGGGSPTTIPFVNAGGGVAALWGVAEVGASTNDTEYGVDEGTGELVQLNFATSSEINLEPLGVTLSGSTSLDYSANSGTLYLYTNGGLYATASTQSAFSSLGAAPAGAVTVVAAENLSVSNNSGLGAFGPASLLPMLGVALMRRRKRARGSQAGPG